MCSCCGSSTPARNADENRGLYSAAVKTLTVRLPDSLAAAIEAESRQRKLPKSDVVRERLERAPAGAADPNAGPFDIADLIGSVDGLPADLSARKKHYLRLGYGRKRSR